MSINGSLMMALPDGGSQQNNIIKYQLHGIEMKIIMMKK